MRRFGTSARPRAVIMFAILALVVGIFSPSSNAEAQPVAQVPAAASLESQVSASALLASTAQSVMNVATVTTLTTYTGLCEGGIRKGPGLKLGNDYVVLYMCLYNGHDYALLCPDPTKPASNPESVGNVTSISGATNFYGGSYVAWNYARYSDGGGSKRYDNNWAAASRLVYWTHTGQAARAKTDLAYASSTVKSLYNTMLTNSTKYSGPYKITYVSQSVPQLNNNGWRKYRLTSGKGYGIPGVTFSWKITAGTASLLTATSKTDANGYFTVSYKATRWNTVTFAATSNVVAANSQKFWKPVYSTYQRFYSGVGANLKVGFSVALAPKNVGLTYNCTTACFGEAPVKTTAPVCNVYNTSMRIELLDNGTVRPEVYTPAIGTCTSPVWKVKDNHTAQMRISAYVNGTWVYYFFAKIVVDCPPWPIVQFSGQYTCTDGWLTVTAPANPEHAVRVVINGVPQNAAVGLSASKTVTFSCSTAHPFTIQTGVQRDNGQWNMSPTASVGFPAVVS